MKEITPALVTRRDALRVKSHDDARLAGGSAQGRADYVSEESRGGLLDTDLHSSLSDPVLTTMNFLNEVTEQYPAAISFAPGRPYGVGDGIEDIVRYLRTYKDYLEREGLSPDSVRSAFYQYGPTAGRIRDIVAAWLRNDEQVDVAPEAIVITAGCQEAMLLTLRALTRDSRDVILVSSPCYTGITGAARLLDIPIVGVAEEELVTSRATMRRVVTEQQAKGRRPRAMYVMPDHANPSGNTMPVEVREGLLEVADELNILLIEDSPYRLVSPGPRLPTLKALDRTERVVHLGSFSKSGFPGARVGFVVADQWVRRPSGSSTLLAAELTKLKSMVTLNTSALGQAAIAGMLLEGQSSLDARNGHRERTLCPRIDEDPGRTAAVVRQ